MGRALVGAVVGGYNRGPKPSWLADQADVERAILRKRESELLAEIALLKAASEPEPAAETTTPAVDEKLSVAAHAGTELVPAAVELDLELVGAET